eukprot:749092-Hanusia_phi.AAC.4
MHRSEFPLWMKLQQLEEQIRIYKETANSNDRMPSFDNEKTSSPEEMTQARPKSVILASEPS